VLTYPEKEMSNTFAEFVFNICRSPVTTELGKKLEHKTNSALLMEMSINWIQQQKNKKKKLKRMSCHRRFSRRSINGDAAIPPTHS